VRILIAYPGAIHSTYDVAAGYEKALRAIGHDVYGYPYHKWLGFYADTLKYWEEHNEQYTFTMDDVALQAANHLVIAAVDFEPDVVLIISGSALHRRAYDLLHKMCLPLVLLLTESPYEDEIQSKIVDQGHIAHAFTNEIYSVEPLSVNGASVSYLPHSFDPDVHKPMDVNGEHASDVFFHGTLWVERARLIEELLGMDIDLCVSGISMADVQRGELVDNDKLAQMYNGAKICLNHHRTTKREAGDTIASNAAASIGPRAYEIAACGAFQLCDDTRPELRAIFGHAVPTYQNAADLRARIEYFLDRPNERRELADMARERVQDCSFMHRVIEFVEPIFRRI